MACEMDECDGNFEHPFAENKNNSTLWLSLVTLMVKRGEKLRQVFY